MPATMQIAGVKHPTQVTTTELKHAKQGKVFRLFMHQRQNMSKPGYY